ncbi:hypothetical protein CSKR_100218 [Clonorchis sinensis]|uniref:Uncharacterized protein n=1 Tax=Clonorchis sinensis TaxID=79923 RepID=A0A419PPY1_CLOSI|nr:hypothetical protein CSKR_100218 [Clonorchis sinensis]
MHAHPHSVVSTPYSYDSNTIQQGQIQIVDTNVLHSDSEPFMAGLGAEVSNSDSQLIYSDPSASGPSQLTDEHYLHDGSTDNIMYQQTANPLVMPQGSPQQDMDIEPIDLEEVQKIQARMPAADPSAPVGSNKNPIRIIQQGNQYITTQDVSDEHLQQIIQVLTNQALISSSSARPSAIYNRLTNRRIIFRVTKAKRRHDDNDTSSGGGGSGTASGVFGPDRSRAGISKSKQRNPAKGGSRKRRKRGSDEEDPDFEPEVPEEEILPFPLARRTSTSGRISKPPKHLVKDYKHLRLEDLTSKPESDGEDYHSDGGYSDYINSGAGSSDEDKGGPYPCSACTKIFNSRAGLTRHRTVAHGSNQGKPRTVNPYVAAMRRRTKLREAVSQATDDELIEFAAPRLSKLLDPWDHLLLRSVDGNPLSPQLPRVVLDYLSLVERARAFLVAHLDLWTPNVAESRPREYEQASNDQEQEQPIEPEEQRQQQNGGLAVERHQQETVEQTAVVCPLPPEPVENHEDGTLDEVLPQESTADEVTIIPELVDGVPENPSEVESTIVSTKPSAQSEAEGTMLEEPTQNGRLESPNENSLDESERVLERNEEEEDEDEDVDDGQAIIVKIDTDEQSNILGLPCGKYVVKDPLCEDYLSRRFRSILAAQRAAAVSAMEAEEEKSEQAEDRPTVSVEAADDTEVDATLREDIQPVVEGEEAYQTNVNTTNDEEPQGVIALGDELVLVPEGGLGGPVPEEWLTSGAFLAVLTEAGELCDLVMEAATGRLFHRPTGHLVSLADGSAVSTQQEPEIQAVPTLPDYGAYEDEQPSVTAIPQRPAVQDTRPAAKIPSPSKPKGRSKAKQTLQEQRDPGEFDAAASEQEQLLQRLAETGEVIDLNTLFPGVSVTEVSPGVCLVTKPNGDRFNVEHGGEGITLETLQTILQMDA